MSIARHNENNSFLSLVMDMGRFSYLPSGTASLSYQFLSVSKTLYKIKILQKFLFGRKLFEAWHLTEMPRIIVKKLANQSGLMLAPGFYRYGKLATPNRSYPTNYVSVNSMKFFRPINPLKIASEDPLTFSERPLDVQLIFLYAQKSTSQVHSDDTSGLSWNFLSKILSEFRN